MKRPLQGAERHPKLLALGGRAAFLEQWMGWPGRQDALEHGELGVRLPEEREPAGHRVVQAWRRRRRPARAGLFVAAVSFLSEDGGRADPVVDDAAQKALLSDEDFFDLRQGWDLLDVARDSGDVAQGTVHDLVKACGVEVAWELFKLEEEVL